MIAQPKRADRFSYGALDIDEESGTLWCHYALDSVEFVEVVSVGAGYTWTPAAREAARLVHLTAGISYYKAGAPSEIDLGLMTVRPGERDFLRSFYLEGLGEFSYRNELDLGDLRIVGGVENSESVRGATDPGRPLIPFGGGLDSVVTVEAAKRIYPDSALFVVNRRGVERFRAIERAAVVTGLEVVRAEREIDAKLLHPAELGPIFNGHVPITGIISSIAVLAAVLSGRGKIVMSNEWSASHENFAVGDLLINHQYSKSSAFENGFRELLERSLGSSVDYFSMLRPFSELWVAKRFAELSEYHEVVHSCNRAFHLDPSLRLEEWCGHCDKCCFIDLILAPFLDRATLLGIFGANEPLDDVSLIPKFRSLLGLGDELKPFECVGDVGECRSAAVLARDRADRARSPVLAALVEELGLTADRARASAGDLLHPLESHHIPDELLAAALG